MIYVLKNDNNVDNKYTVSQQKWQINTKVLVTKSVQISALIDFFFQFLIIPEKKNQCSRARLLFVE